MWNSYQPYLENAVAIARIAKILQTEIPLSLRKLIPQCLLQLGARTSHDHKPSPIQLYPLLTAQLTAQLKPFLYPSPPPPPSTSLLFPLLPPSNYASSSFSSPPMWSTLSPFNFLLQDSLGSQALDASNRKHENPRAWLRYKTKKQDPAQRQKQNRERKHEKKRLPNKDNNPWQWIKTHNFLLLFPTSSATITSK